nr:hypothetical protein [Tanacetum cinerariifolium]
MTAIKETWPPLMDFGTDTRATIFLETIFLDRSPIQRVLVVRGLNVGEVGIVEVLWWNVGDFRILGEIRIQRKIRVCIVVVVEDKYGFEIVVAIIGIDRV